MRTQQLTGLLLAVALAGCVSTPSMESGLRQPKGELPDIPANHLVLVRFLGLAPIANQPAVPSAPLDAADVAVAQSCKDRVDAGEKFPVVATSRAKPVAPVTADPLALETLVFQINNCLDAKDAALRAVASPTIVANPALH